MGGKIYKAPSFTKHPIRYQRFIQNFYKEHPEYNVVHGHNLDAAAMLYMRRPRRRDVILLRIRIISMTVVGVIRKPRFAVFMRLFGAIQIISSRVQMKPPVLHLVARLQILATVRSSITALMWSNIGLMKRGHRASQERLFPMLRDLCLVLLDG